VGRIVCAVGFAAFGLIWRAPCAFANCATDDPDGSKVAAARSTADQTCSSQGTGCDSANHGAYVSCVAHVARDLVTANMLPKSCKSAVKKCAAHSTCGKPGAVTCCLTTAKGTKCKIKKDPASCAAKNGTVGTCASCCDACPPPGRGPSCPATTTTTPTATSTTTTTTTASSTTTSHTTTTQALTTTTTSTTTTTTPTSTTTTTLRFVDNGDGTVMDSQTGLIWEKKVDGHNCLHCVYDSYTWSASGPTPDGTAFTTFLTDLNGGATGTGNCVSSDGSTQIGGFNNQCDWRLPTIGEFQTIVDVSAPGCALGSPCIAPIFGPTLASYYFSASVDDTAHPNGVWGVEFFDGTEVGLNSDARIFVRAVRGPRAPSTTPRFIDNGDGTVTDHQTGLQWEQKVAGSSCLHCVNDTYAWTSSGTAPDAFRNFLNYLNGGATGVGNCTSGDGNSQIGGFENHCDWRLPTIAELRTTLDTSQGNCGGGSGACIDPTFGPTAASLYWSSTTFAGAPSVAWFVGFSNGEVFNDGKGKNLSVRAVRGGS